MKPIIIKVPKRLTLETTVKFANLICELPDSNRYTFDFDKVGRIEPFALLFLSSELQRCRSKHSDSDFVAANYEACTYSAHMGFFKAFGLDHGKEPGEAKGSSTYLPITIFNVNNILKKAAANFEEAGYFIERQAEEMSSILTRDETGDLFDTLTYSIREIIRNVIEHSQSNQFGFCAQYWPSYESVQLSIIDRGVGIKSGLSQNPKLKVEDNHSALNLALMPGISGKAYKGSRNKMKGVWANSGFGLYMTSRLCREGGSFFIASGDIGLYLSEKKRKYLNTPFEGTVLRLALKTNRLASLNSRLSKYREEAQISGHKITASMASSMLSKDFR